MQRHTLEVVHSQRQMLRRLQQTPQPLGDEQLLALLQKHEAQVRAWLARQPGMEICYVSYNDLLSEPGQHVQRVGEFLETPLDLQKMLQVVDPGLYRNRS
jgi:LPS sulfotransferase NodH